MKFYNEERKIFHENYQINLKQEETIHAFNKLKRHYKLNANLVFREMYTSSGRFRYSKRAFLATTTIILCKNSCFGALIHEVAHAVEFKKYRRTRHAKRLMRIIRTITNHCRRRDWFGVGTKTKEVFVVEEGRELECLIPLVVKE